MANLGTLLLQIGLKAVLVGSCWAGCEKKGEAEGLHVLDLHGVSFGIQVKEFTGDHFLTGDLIGEFLNNTDRSALCVFGGLGKEPDLKPSELNVEEHAMNGGWPDPDAHAVNLHAGCDPKQSSRHLQSDPEFETVIVDIANRNKWRMG